MANFNELSQKLINSYQKKICCYDKQQWEKSIEDQILFRAENISTSHSQSTHSPNCTNHDRLATLYASTPSSIHPHMTNDLIDLDLISGSAYIVKPKSQQGWLSSFGHAILRVLFFPLYLRWWSERTSAKFASLLLLLYILQVTALRLYYHRGITLFTIQNLPAAFINNETSSNLSSPSSTKASNEFSEVPPTEVLMPIAMMFVLGIIHTQIVGTKSSTANSSTSSTASSRKSSSIRCGNAASITEEDSSHTDQSSTSLSSSSTSSTPPSSVEHPLNKPIKQEKLASKLRNIPQIKIHDAQSAQDIILVHDDPDSANPSEDDHKSEQSNTLPLSSPLPTRRYSDSKSHRSSKQSFTQCRRRYSESHCDKPFAASEPITTAAPPSNATKRKLLKSRTGPGSNQARKFRCDRSWSQDRHSKLLPKAVSSKGYAYYPTNCSSYDSEGTVSPVTPIASLPGDDWPMIYSDANTSGESEEENQFDKYPKPPFVANKPAPKSPPAADFATYHQGSNRFSKPISGSAPTYPRPSFAEPLPSNELKVSCSIWQHNAWQKVDLSVMDLSSAIIRKVDSVEHSCEYIYLGLIFSFAISLLPTIFRMQYLLTASTASPTPTGIISPSGIDESAPVVNSTGASPATAAVSPDYTDYLIQVDLFGLFNLFLDASLFFGKSLRLRLVICIAMFERFVLSLMYFFMLCVAERTFKQRFLYSKYFSQITRRDRAKRSQVPFFRLHKVSYLKVWLSVRSYLRRHGPLRSVDTICSTSFILAVCLLTCISLQLLKDTSESYTSRLICWEMVFWSLAIGIYIMRLMILGSRINQKYRSNLSVLITEQINLHLQLERKPQKKEDLMLANHVLKLAADLIKELEAPYKISGFSANPYLYNITKVVVLSAFSALLTEMLGFKLKLDKINLIK